MKIETEFVDEFAIFPADFKLHVTLEGRPEWVEAALKSIRETMDKFDRVAERKH